MKCIECGGPMNVHRENYRYDACGLPVTLVGVEVDRCRKCGGHEVAIPRIEELHRVIAGVVIARSSRLGAAEVRLLRKVLGWSGADFARHLGVDPSTVSRWEHGRQAIGPVADRLLRMMVARREPTCSYPLEALAKVGSERAGRTRIDVVPAGDGWRAVAAQVS